jgi:hypothetical protein
VLSRPFAADNIAHMMSLLSQIESGTDLELQLDYPELLNGDDAISVGESIALYRTWANEALGLLGSYPNPRSLL